MVRRVRSWRFAARGGNKHSSRDGDGETEDVKDEKERYRAHENERAIGTMLG